MIVDMNIAEARRLAESTPKDHPDFARNWNKWAMMRAWQILELKRQRKKEE